MDIFIAVAIGVAAGGVFGFFIGRMRLNFTEKMRTLERELYLQRLAEQKEQTTKQLEQLEKSHAEAIEREQSAAEKQKDLYLRQLAEQKELQNEQRQILEKQLKEQAELQKENAQKEYEKLKEEFKVLAEKVLVEKSADFEKNGKTQLDILLTPFKTKLEEFKNTTDLTRKEALEINARLSEQINSLMKSSQALGEDATNLAKALRSDNKMLGNWGEMILDEILSSSGLVEKVHYHKQLTLTDDNDNALHNDETGKVMRPDVVINYPDGKVVIIDSKVSLNDYIDWVNAENPEARQQAAAKHLKSVKAHMDGLSKKNYSSYICKDNQEAAEFVIMFMPNAGAYELAMQSDITLWRHGFEKKILLVSPVNLMALLQLIHIGWKRYEQDRNQQKILDGAAQLLERLQKFYDSFDKVGDLLEKANKSFNDAAGVLRGGNGKHSIARKGQELAELGVKLKKRLAVPKRFQGDDTALEDCSDAIEVSSGEDDNSTNI